MNDAIRILACHDAQPLLDGLCPPCRTDIRYFKQADRDVVEKIACLQPDVVLLPLFMPGADAIDVMKGYAALFGSSMPYFAVLCPFLTPRLRQELNACGAGTLLLRPYEPREMEGVLRDVAVGKGAARARFGIYTVHKIHGAQESQSATDETALNDTVDGILRELGVPANSAGYHYLKRAVVLAVQDEKRMYSVTLTLYPVIAEEFHTTPSCVERRIRHTIIGAWQVGNSSVIASYFGNTVDNMRGKPANSEFIAMLADRIRLSMRSAERFAVV